MMVSDKHLVFDAFDPSFPRHLKFYLLYEILSPCMTPNDIVFL